MLDRLSVRTMQLGAGLGSGGEARRAGLLTPRGPLLRLAGAAPGLRFGTMSTWYTRHASDTAQRRTDVNRPA